MPMPLDDVITRYKDGAEKLAEHLRQREALRNELRRSADEAEAAGFQDFAEILLEMADKLGGTSSHNGKDPAAPSRRRGRPPKLAADQNHIT